MGQNVAGQTWGLPGRYASAQSERELPCLGIGPVAAWPPRAGCRPQRANLPGDALLDESFPHDLGSGHRQGGPETAFLARSPSGLFFGPPLDAKRGFGRSRKEE